MVKAVIFDMDGVLVDTEPVYYRRLEEFLISRGYHFFYYNQVQNVEHAVC